MDYLSDTKKIGLGKSLLKNNFSTDDLDYSISSKFNDFQIIKSYEKKIKNQKNIFSSSFTIDFLSGNLIFENNTKLKTPIINTNQNIYITSEDVDGKPKENLTEIIYANRRNILSKDKFEIIAKCVQINSFFDLNEKCEYGQLKILRQNNKYLINFKKMVQGNNYYFNKDDYNSSFLKEKNFLKKSIENYENLQPNKSTKFLTKKIKLILQNINPKIFYFTRDLYRELKYHLLKIKINGIKQAFFSNNFKVKSDNFIAHSGGSIDGNIYTNSLEALDLSYSKGIRILELDLKLTSDNQLVAVHDWKSWKKMTKYSKKIPPSKNDFMNLKILGKYSPIDLNKINEWKTKHKDTVIITDKFDNLKILNNSFQKNQKYIHEIYDYNQLLFAFNHGLTNILVSEKILRENNFSIKFLNRLKENDIYGLSVSRYSIYKLPEFYKKVRDMGLRVFVYRLNDGLPGGSEKEVICNFNNYLDAIYADDLPNFYSSSEKKYCD